MGNYNLTSISIRDLLNNIENNIIAIPEIQRPFLWKPNQVKDLIDSLYKNYPVGYLIFWQDDEVEVKGNISAKDKQIIIDGQQRITSISAALLGKSVVDDRYQTRGIRISFNPITEEFEVYNSNVKRSDAWINDISVVFTEEFSAEELVRDYSSRNEIEPEEVYRVIKKLSDIADRNLGLIELSSDLTIDEISEIFRRINFHGLEMTQTDFALTKIAARSEYDGHNLRKAIDYFTHLLERPEDFDNIKKSDIDFASKEYFQNLEWTKDAQSIYTPSYHDTLRVIFTYKFRRGRIKDFVELLAGYNFETRTYDRHNIEGIFQRLKEGLLDFINEENFTSYLQRLRNIGLIRENFIQSKSVINFGYVLYLLLVEKGISPEIRNKSVERWLILSNISKRYSGSSESTFQQDINLFTNSDDIVATIDAIEAEELDDAFWNLTYIDTLSTQHTPTFYTFVMAQVVAEDQGFLSTTTVEEIFDDVNDKRHVFPREYLLPRGFTNQDINQIANNVLVAQDAYDVRGVDSPSIYLLKFNERDWHFKENAIPAGLDRMTNRDYPRFLEERRKLMAEKVKEYYESFK